MANRVLVGKRGSDHGLFVSRSGQNVETSTDPLAFDSRAAETLIVSSYGQGILVPQVQHRTTGAQLTFTYSSTTYNQHQTTIKHNLGYIPCYAVRFCTANQISSGVATSSYTCFRYTSGNGEYTEEDQNEEGDEITFPSNDATTGLFIDNVTTNSFRLTNTGHRAHDDTSAKAFSLGNDSVYFYSYVIFTADNFLNGKSL